uniref:Uncharacterized protein n=1 Tax=Siphoviridae sp. ct9zP9 TaxID=2827795 RepID=A0A8S5SH90_9CAUD|nr:MAG TPA: hypothetical protein [Siphoviridae sp. ct9zP9]
MIAQKSYKCKRKHLDKLPKCRYYNGNLISYNYKL